MASAISIISSAAITHSELTASMYAQSVGEMLLDKVTGELAAARADDGRSIALGILAESEGEAYGDSVAFYDREGKSVICTVEEGLLHFHYEDFDWALDPKAYMSFRITQMEIRRKNDKNDLEVSFQIKNRKRDLNTPHPVVPNAIILRQMRIV